MAGKRTYTREEADAILARAVDRDHGGGVLSHEELLETAREAGISAEALDRATREIDRERLSSGARDEVRRRLRRQFVSHLTSYVLVICFLVAVNVLTSTAYLWFVWPALGWGLLLLFHAQGALFPSDERVEQIAERAARRRERRRERAAVEGGGVRARVEARAASPRRAEDDEVTARAVEEELDAEAAAAEERARRRG